MPYDKITSDIQENLIFLEKISLQLIEKNQAVIRTLTQENKEYIDEINTYKDRIAELEEKIDSIEQNSNDEAETSKEHQVALSDLNAVIEEKAILQKRLFAEMDKVDKMQMELEITTKERDIAIRNKGLSEEQKKILIKVEHEYLKLTHTLEHMEHIDMLLEKIIQEEVK